MKKFGLLNLIFAFILTGCGLGKDNTLPPSPLPDFRQSMQLSTLWSEHIGPGTNGYYLRLSPAADNNTIFAASNNGQITAVNAKTGHPIWTVKINESITSGLAAGNNAIYVGTAGANVFALSQTDGHTLWKQPVTNEMLAAPQYADNIVVVHTLSGSVIALSAQDGHRLWRFDQSVPSLILHAASQPQISNNIVVVGFADGELSAFNLHNGQPLWNQHIAYPTGDNPITQMVDVTVTPVIVKGIVYAATYQGKVAAFDLYNGQAMWEHDISSHSGIAATNTQLFVSDAESNIWAFDTDTGTVEWKQIHLLGRQITGPVIFNNAIVVADRYGFLHAVSQQDGHFLSRLKIGDGTLTEPIIYQNNLYLYTEKGNLTAVHA